MNKKLKTILVLLSLFIFIFSLNYFNICNNDLIWNYGFSYNFAKGLKMYADYNMVITPLYPTIFGLIMKLFGTNILVFYLSNTLISTVIFYIIYKYYNKAFLPSLILITFAAIPNYNFLCLMFLFILFVLEDKKKNDYLIGLVLGLSFLTKTPMILLCLASFYYLKDYKKIIKRIIGFLIPNIIYIIYFIINGSLFDYFNYAFLSLLDFAQSNMRFRIGILIFIASIIYLIYKYKKDKDIKLLYILFFQIMSYPIFNYWHVYMSFVPLCFYILLTNKNKLYLKYKKWLAVLLISPLIATILVNSIIPMHKGINALKYKNIETKYYNDAQIIKKQVDNLDNTYFIMYEAYYNKYLLGLKINKYDLLLQGNLGYDGENKVIEYFDSLSDGTQFLMLNTFEQGQSSEKIYNHIKNNYKLVKMFDKYMLYEK